MLNIREIEPKKIWNYFEDLNEIPRASKKEKKISQFIANIGKKLGLETYVDRAMNVIIKKPATIGFENKQSIILQAHLDMVHQKNQDTNFNFDKQGIQSYIDEDWLKAKGTTLGADNGIGVATMLTVLANKELQHPAIECLFTVDEETGMSGAKALEPNKLSGKILLNLDSEDDSELIIGCAGGMDISVDKQYKQTNIKNNYFDYKIIVKGLKGGHSGMDIHLGRGNANKILACVLYNLKEKSTLYLANINGGGLRNAIPREAEALIKTNINIQQNFINLVTGIKKDFQNVEPNLQISLENSTINGQLATIEETNQIINSLHASFNGVFKMSHDLTDLVEASSNMAQVIMKDGNFKVDFFTRSSLEESKLNCANSIKACFQNINCKVEFSGYYPGWKPNSDSFILKKITEVYKQEFNQKPAITACHAGLECGIISNVYPNLDMISLGPTIRNPHSPDEKVNIKSVQKFWKLLKNTLINL